MGVCVSVYALAFIGSKAQPVRLQRGRPPVYRSPTSGLRPWHRRSGPLGLPSVGIGTALLYSYHQTCTGAHMGPLLGIDLLDKMAPGLFVQT